MSDFAQPERPPLAQAFDEETLVAARRARMLLLDVDGILTDGRLFFDAEGRESKVFHVQDGAGIVYWRRCGFVAGFLSGRDAPCIRVRAEELAIDEVELGKGQKLPVFEEILKRQGLSADEVVYMGDDLLDLDVLREVGLPVSVPQGRPEVKALCRYVTATPGGHGAVRELVDLLLEAKGLLADIVKGGGRPSKGA